MKNILIARDIDGKPCVWVRHGYTRDHDEDCPHEYPAVRDVAFDHVLDRMGQVGGIDDVIDADDLEQIIAGYEARFGPMKIQNNLMPHNFSRPLSRETVMDSAP